MPGIGQITLSRILNQHLDGSWMDTFVKRDGRWQCVANYAVKVQ